MLRLSRPRLLVLVLAASAMTPADAQAQLLLEEGFEGGDLTAWRPSGNDTASIVRTPVRSGSRAVNMRLGPSDAEPDRTEITSDSGVLAYDREYWIGFSFNVLRWDTPIPSWATLFQFHAVPGQENWDNCVAGRNPFTVTVNDGRLGVAAIKSSYAGPLPAPGGAIADEVWSAPLLLSRWYDWVVRLRPSLTAGILEVWLNGTKVYSQLGGANVDAIDDCGVRQEPWVYLKIGVYKEHTNAANEDSYFDEIRIYQGAQGYDRVRPGGPSAPRLAAPARLRVLR